MRTLRGMESRRCRHTHVIPHLRSILSDDRGAHPRIE
jgi:hypothetical protein